MATVDSLLRLLHGILRWLGHRRLTQDSASKTHSDDPYLSNPCGESKGRCQMAGVKGGDGSRKDWKRKGGWGRTARDG